MDEKIIFLSPEEEFTNVLERLERSDAGSTILVIPLQSHLRSNVGWWQLRSSVRKLGRDVTIISSDPHIRSVAKDAGFRVAFSLESPPSDSHRPINRPVRKDMDGKSSQSSKKQASNGKKITHPLLPDQQKASKPIHDIHLGMPDISDVPNKVYDADIEDLGDFGAGKYEVDWPSQASDNQKLEKSEGKAIPPNYGVPPQSSRTGNKMQPKLDDLGDEDDLIPLPGPIDDQPMSTTSRASTRPYGTSTPSTAGRREPQPIIQPRKPLTSKDSRDFTPPPYSTLKSRSTPRPPARNQRGGTRGDTSRNLFIALLVLAILLLLLLAGIAMSNHILPGVVYLATVTITPASRDLKNTYVITGVVGIPDASKRQIQARLLSTTTTSPAKTILVSGVGYIPATAARGSLTLYNAMPYSQAIAAGTVFINNNGMQFVNDKMAIIPAARPPTEGSVTVPVHSITNGTKGNIPAFTFNDVPCCIAGITVQNQAAFSGGQDQRDYTFVQQSDIDGIVNAEKPSLIQHAESVLHAEFFQNEQLINPDECTSNISSDHVAGDKATSVTVALTVTCTGEVIDGREALSIAANLLTRQAMLDPGAGYALVGNIVTTIQQTRLTGVNSETVILLVSAEGIWANQFSDSSKRMLTALIADKNSTDAQSLLMHQDGIAKADIQITGIFASLLPDDPGRITIVIQGVRGL